MNNDSELTLFEPEVVLPAQMSWGARCDATTSGVRALMLAILEEATLCIERGRGRRHQRTRQLSTEAEAWVRSDSLEWLFSFASICDVLGFDPDALRGRLLARVEGPSSSGRAARPQADEPSTPSGVMVRMPQCERARGSIAALTTGRAPTRHTGGGRGTGAGFGVRPPSGGCMKNGRLEWQDALRTQTTMRPGFDP